MHLQCAFPNKIKLQYKNTHQHAPGHQYICSMAQLYDKSSSLLVCDIALISSDLTTNLQHLKVNSLNVTNEMQLLKIFIIITALYVLGTSRPSSGACEKL